MIKYKSTETGKEYDTLKEATGAEIALKEKKKAEEEEAMALQKAIDKAYVKMIDKRREYLQAEEEFNAIAERRKAYTDHLFILSDVFRDLVTSIIG